MFKKILIANRGEIACRIIRTAKKMGIATVAVYSDADANSLHVQLADESVRIGPAEPSKSYLQIKKIINAMKRTGAEAVHPGYGFLSENAEFAKAVHAARKTFIGPPIGAIKSMGDKIESKKLAKEAGVNVIPGYIDVVKTAEDAADAAKEIGFPVMIKASAGGGGKGMRIAYNENEIKEGFRSASNEAMSSFADDRMLIEKYVQEPRHIEIQILADTKGNFVYLGERECTIQRRHQKVIEESPSIFVDKRMRRKMGLQAILLAKKVNYFSAGTVEFVVSGKDKNFYFLEMNTRLQVEHPVTELVTGIDLVEQMILIAAGQKIKFKQRNIKLNGWAIESRIYAEDPSRNFLPSIGRLSEYTHPAIESNAQKNHIRVDTGVEEGSEISMFYDPMISKLCTYGSNRRNAIKNMREALNEFCVEGVSHNINFLSSVLCHQKFIRGNISTNFIGEEYPKGYSPLDSAHKEEKLLAAIACFVHRRFVERSSAISGQITRPDLSAYADWIIITGKKRYRAKVLDSINQDSGFVIKLNNQKFRIISDWQFGDKIFRTKYNGEKVSAKIQGNSDSTYSLFYNGAQLDVFVLSPNNARLQKLMPKERATDSSKSLLSPMPGLLVSIAVKPDQSVRAGEELAVIEAMKMENILRAEKDCTIKTIEAEAGKSVEVDQIILTMK